jgi:hypothetical protein
VLETWESKCDYDDGVHAEQQRKEKHAEHYPTVIAMYPLATLKGH